ncbi:hypothetical protein CDL12_02629 [Handroanthus impetiginosus]|uniref:DUF4216 domain-containing protein n=1 Tax=Handroanthus impetiginosus TaxID=429701 RepID=A0A2G9I4E1_9LAMI|nr:hypothetical protein CDL12_02629 [Handroanthus impetiginosus]
MLKEMVELEYCGYPIKKVILFLCDWFDPTPIRGTRIVHLEYKLMKVRQRGRYIKGRVKVEEMLEVTHQNDMLMSVDTIMPNELCENLLDHSHPIENVNEAELLRNHRTISDKVENKVESDEDEGKDEDELGDEETSESGNSI